MQTCLSVRYSFYNKNFTSKKKASEKWAFVTYRTTKVCENLDNSFIVSKKLCDIGSLLNIVTLKQTKIILIKYQFQLIIWNQLLTQVNEWISPPGKIKKGTINTCICWRNKGKNCLLWKSC